MGVPLLAEYGKTKVRLAIRELAQRIHGADACGSESAQARGMTGLLSKMFSKG